MRVDVAGNAVYAYTGTSTPAAVGRAVVFVHGAAQDHSVFALQSRYLAHHGRAVLAVDLPGHGRSAGAPLASVEALADWLVALLDALALERAALVGYSLGSLVALDCAARHGARVERIALLGCAVPMAVSEALLTAARDDPEAAYAMINGWSTGPAKQLGANPQPGFWLMGSAMRLMERCAPGVLHIDLGACNAYARGLELAPQVACPALLVQGARDLMAPPRNAQALAEALRDVKTVTLPGCGHALMAEAPDAVLDALRRFA